MLQRVRRAWKLSGKVPEALEKLTDADIGSIPNAGDGKAEFFGSGTEEEFKQMEAEDSGMKAWFDRLKNL